jgi:hypothetical protein
MSKALSNTIRIVVVFLTIGMSLLLCGILAMGALSGFYTYADATHWREKTSPLDPAVIEDICVKFALPSDDSRCQPGVHVYAPDFFDVITRAFRPHDGVSSTYDEVQEKLGKYQFDYNPPVTTGDGLTYFRAWYDLKGDRVYPIVMFFYADGRLWRIIADVGD